MPDPQAALLNSAPNLFILGAPKCGTTTLASVLQLHPRAFMSSRKEPRFFCRDSEYERGLEWYLNTYFAAAGKYPTRGEATPTYLYWHDKVIPRLKRYLSGQALKFIAILRNPVDRAYSHYWMNRERKMHEIETLSFEEALEAEEVRTTNHPLWQREGILSFNYFGTGLYADQVAAYQVAFGRDRCLFLLFEDLVPDVFADTIKRVHDFLGLEAVSAPYLWEKESMRVRSKRLAATLHDPGARLKMLGRLMPEPARVWIRFTLRRLNSVPFQYTPMRPGTRRNLTERYKPSLHRLERLLERDLSGWLDGRQPLVAMSGDGLQGRN